MYLRLCRAFWVCLLLTAGCGGDSSAEISKLRAENAELRQQVSDPNTYVCKVGQAQELRDDGVLSEAPAHVSSETVGSTFIVDRKSGLISGAVGNNLTFETRDVTFTPPNNPYYVVSTSHGPNKNLDYLIIRDWVDGVDKPFLLADSRSVFSGTCR